MDFKLYVLALYLCFAAGETTAYAQKAASSPRKWSIDAKTEPIAEMLIETFRMSEDTLEEIEMFDPKGVYPVLRLKPPEEISNLTLENVEEILAEKNPGEKLSFGMVSGQQIREAYICRESLIGYKQGNIQYKKLVDESLKKSYAYAPVKNSTKLTLEEKEDIALKQIYNDVEGAYLAIMIGKENLAKLKTPRTGKENAIQQNPTQPQKEVKNRSIAGVNAGQLRPANSVGMKMVWIPSGSFTMGSPASEAGRSKDEGQVKVTLTEGYWMGQTEVTQGQWTKLMGTSPWRRGQKSVKDVKEGVNHPASFVSRNDAEGYMKKLTAQERQSGKLPDDWEYALPTEAQWEYACRYGNAAAFSFGNDADQLSKYAWFADNVDRVLEEFPHEVGTKLPNSLGLHDIHGNVHEWCRDDYLEKLPGGIDPKVVAAFSVYRGGSWKRTSRLCRSAIRYMSSPGVTVDDVGFRVALVPVAK